MLTDWQIQNPFAIGIRDLEYYTIRYSQTGAIPCAFNAYRVFEIKREIGALSFIPNDTKGMVKEMYENVTNAVVNGTGHW